MGGVYITTILVLFQVVTPYFCQPAKIIANPEMPWFCDDLQYCLEKGDLYPEDYVAKLLKGPLTTMIDKLEQYNNPFHHRLGSTDTLTREGGSIQCENDYQISPVYYIIDIHNRTRVVIQKYGVFEQLFVISTCLDRHPVVAKNSPISEEVARTYGLVCEQETANYEFFVLSHDYNSIEQVRMKSGLPVWCVCKHRREHR